MEENKPTHQLNQIEQHLAMIETMTAQPLCDVRHHSEKRRIEELTMTEQTEKKRKIPVGLEFTPTLALDRPIEPCIADSKGMTRDHRRFPLSL